MAHGNETTRFTELVGCSLPIQCAAMSGMDGTMRRVPRFFASPPTRAFTGTIEAMALYAGMGIGAITARIAAADVVAELISELRPD